MKKGVFVQRAFDQDKYSEKYQEYLNEKKLEREEEKKLEAEQPKKEGGQGKRVPK